MSDTKSCLQSLVVGELDAETLTESLTLNEAGLYYPLLIGVASTADTIDSLHHPGLSARQASTMDHSPFYLVFIHIKK